MWTALKTLRINNRRVFRRIFEVALGEVEISSECEVKWRRKFPERKFCESNQGLFVNKSRQYLFIDKPRQ